MHYQDGNAEQSNTMIANIGLCMKKYHTQLKYLVFFILFYILYFSYSII